MNLSLKTGIFPDVWKVATVRPIPKTVDLTNVNNIRPISLTALPGKLLEKYIHTNLVSFLEDNKLLCKSQGGFRKNRSTTQTVYQLVNDVANATNYSKFSLAIYLDIAKAFDSINHDYLLKEKKTQSKCMFRLGDDDIESPYKNFLDTFDFFV